MTVKTLFPVLLISVLMFGCKGRECPGFPDNFTVYMPYAENEVIPFVDNDYDSVFMTVIDSYKHEHEYLEWGCKCECQFPYYSVHLSFECFQEKALTMSAYVPHLRESATEDELGFCLNNGYCNYYYQPGNYYDNAVSFHYKKINDTVLFTLFSDSSFFDSLIVVKGVGLASFNTADGHTYHLAR